MEKKGKAGYGHFFSSPFPRLNVTPYLVRRLLLVVRKEKAERKNGGSGKENKKRKGGGSTVLQMEGKTEEDLLGGSKMSLGLENSKRSRHGALAKKDLSPSPLSPSSFCLRPHMRSVKQKGERAEAEAARENVSIQFGTGWEERYRPNLPHARARDARIFKRRPPPIPPIRRRRC